MLNLKVFPAFAFAALVVALSLAQLAAASPEKEACMLGVREQYRAALEACMKKPFGVDRNRCRDRADRAERAGREACRKQRPPASPFQRN